MRLRTALPCLSFFMSFAALASARPPELSVCVDVVVQRPAPKPQRGREEPAPPVPAPSAAPEAAPEETPAAADGPGEEPVKAQSEAVASASSAALLGPKREPRTLDSPPESDAVTGTDLRARSGARLPLGQTPEVYLKRLIEHFVTHEVGYVAVQRDCKQRVTVELYPLSVGWTAFARYSGTGREERVDQLLPHELSQFAERSVLALLHDRPIQNTVDRGNVLWADSLRATQSIRGRGHAVLALGTRVRGGEFDRAVTDAGSPSFGGTEKSVRLFTPMLLTAGYRGQFEEFGVEAMLELDVGTSQVAARRNPAGGHVDYGGSAAVVLHALRYADVRGLTSLYYGGGASFALHWFNAIRPEMTRFGDARNTLLSGGLDVDGILGYEFMRASALSFFLQGELNVPVYAVQSENEDGAVDTWFPGASLKLGAIF